MQWSEPTDGGVCTITAEAGGRGPVASGGPHRRSRQLPRGGGSHVGGQGPSGGQEGRPGSRWVRTWPTAV